MQLNESVCKRADFLNIFEPNQTMCVVAPGDCRVWDFEYRLSAQRAVGWHTVGSLTEKNMGISFMFVCFKGRNDLCLTNRIRICRVPPRHQLFSNHFHNDLKVHSCPSVVAPGDYRVLRLRVPTECSASCGVAHSRIFGRKNAGIIFILSQETYLLGSAHLLAASKPQYCCFVVILYIF